MLHLATYIEDEFSDTYFTCRELGMDIAEYDALEDYMGKYTTNGYTHDFKKGDVVRVKATGKVGAIYSIWAVTKSVNNDIFDENLHRYSREDHEIELSRAV